MANYDRNILVPYLQDVCCSELLCSKLQREIQNCEQEIQKLTSWINWKPNEPKRPYPSAFDSDKSGGYAYIVIWGVIPVLIGLFVASLGGEGYIFLILSLAFGLFCGSLGYSEVKELENRDEKRYEEALEYYNQTIARNEQHKKTVPQWKWERENQRNRLAMLNQQLADAQKLRAGVYSVNVIPSRYRNIHVAYYLFDYFSTCRESDLDKIIQTMLLDEIIQRMDTIIHQNEEIMLNQRIQLALQEEGNRSAAEHHREEMRRIAGMERNLELQADYQQMIVQNQVVTNFLLAAEYLRKE